MFVLRGAAGGRVLVSGPPLSTCGTCSNRGDPTTLSGWWWGGGWSLGHTDPLEFLDPEIKIIGATRARILELWLKCIVYFRPPVFKNCWLRPWRHKRQTCSTEQKSHDEKCMNRVCSLRNTVKGVNAFYRAVSGLGNVVGLLRLSVCVIGR